MLKQVMEMYELLDRADANGGQVLSLLQQRGAKKTELIELREGGGKSDFVRIVIEGKNGKSRGGTAPSMGITGRLGGLGARPALTGFVSDGDGALAALALALKLCDMQAGGDTLEGDIVITTHICPDAPTTPHYPVPMMGCHIEMETINRLEVEHEVDAILSCDTTKGNKIINCNGFAISPTVKQGYILRVSDDLLEIMIRVTGQMPKVFALSQQDITPYGNGLYHLNSILQPAVATSAPVVGVAITAEQPVAGCATGATRLHDVEAAAKFMLEVCKEFTEGKCQVYDAQEFDKIIEQYGTMTHFQLKK